MRTRPRYCDGTHRLRNRIAPGKKPGLGDAEEEAQHDELLEVLHPGEQQRDDAPADHDAREPAAGAELVQREVGGHLEQDVADEEDARGEPELGGAEAEVFVHAVGGGEADRGAVEVVDEEHQRHERHEPQSRPFGWRTWRRAIRCRSRSVVLSTLTPGDRLDSSASEVAAETHIGKPVDQLQDLIANFSR